MPQYYMLNKPQGCITARTDARHKTVMDCFPEALRGVIFPLGRLDRDTEGLLLFTDDGALAAHLMHPKSHVAKVYFFYALGTLDDAARREIERGIKLYPTADYISSPAKVTVLGTSTLEKIRDKLSPADLKRANRKPNTPVFFGTVTVTEGKKHQVKRMLLYGGCRIVYLCRTALGPLTLDSSLAPGEYRPLTESEIAGLY